MVLGPHELITVEFVKSELNKTDGNTKNLQQDLMEAHNKGIVVDKASLEDSKRSTLD